MTGGALDARVVVSRRGGFRLDARVSALAGETVAIMGPSGAGKSTLLAVIAGLEAADSGHVRIDGQDLGGPRPVPADRRGVVLLGQDPRLFPHLSARENVAFGLRARGIARTQAARAADAWLARVGLDGLGDRRPAQLSGGQQQRAALARALATSPRLLLLDEPLTALDPETAGDVRALLHDQLREHADRGVTTTLVVTHDVIDAASLATRLVVMEGGRVSQEGPVREVLQVPATRFAATIAGLNRLVGHVTGGLWHAPCDDGELVFDVPDAVPASAVIALVRPADVRLEPVAAPSRPDASRPPAARGSWLARIVRLEQTPAGARVHTAEPAVAVDLPADAVAALDLSPGTVVRLRVDAAAVRFVPVR
ncbi:MAG: ABC transporter ATP-binding protein [Microbacterium sp.]